MPHHATSLRAALPFVWCRMLCVILSCLTVALVVCNGHGQSQEPSLRMTAAGGAPATVATFTYQPASVGQRIWQHITLFSQTWTTYKQSGQVISRRQVNLTREQVRRITVVEVAPDRQTVQVTYEKAQETHNDPGREPTIAPQVVAQKSYLVSRQKGDLLVRDLQGQAVSDAEAEIVKQNMQAVGRPNALAEFLHGKTMTAGQTETLPEHTVDQLLGWQDMFGTVESVTLTLERLKHLDDQTIAECQLQIQCAPTPELSRRTSMKGKIELDVNTCRLQSTALTAELAVHQQRGPDALPFFVTHEGQANVHAQSRFLR